MRPKFPALALLVLAGCHSSDSDPAPEPTSLAINRELAAERMFGSGMLRMVGASESGQGRDLDGDGDTEDVVLHVFELDRGALGNTGLAFPRSFRRDEVPPPEFLCNDALGVFQVSEEETGADLDQDGIPNEIATWILDWRRGLRALPFAHGAVALDGDLAAFVAGDGAGLGALHVFDARDGSLTTRSLEPSVLFGVRDDLVAFARAELGVADLNADGDATDFAVLHLYDARTRRVVNASFDVVPGGLRMSAGFAGFHVAEALHGGLDLNGDGDAEDLVFVAVDGRTGLTRIPGFGSASFADFLDPDPEGFLLTVPEQDVDRNGDGDTLDDVAVFYDPRTDRLLDTGLATAAGEQMILEGGWIGVSVSEAGQGARDLDGDGFVDSSVAHVYDTRSGRSINLGFKGQWIGAVDGQLLAKLFVAEGDIVFETEFVAWDTRRQRLLHTGRDVIDLRGSAGDRALVAIGEGGEDLNGDGDVLDLVLGVYEGSTGTVRSLGLATSGTDSRIAPNERAGVLVSEPAQGADLNGDGDQGDQVLFHIFLDAPRL